MDFYYKELKKSGWRELTINNEISNINLIRLDKHLTPAINRFMMTIKKDDVVYVISGPMRNANNPLQVSFTVFYQLREYSL
jgi:hypothetical protein